MAGGCEERQEQATPSANLTMKKIAIFYHVGQLNFWKNLYQEQVYSLFLNGLYDACEFVSIGINGTEPLPYTLDKFQVHYNPELILEAHTLKRCWDFCNENPDYNVLYLHTKGCSYAYDNKIHFIIQGWRLFMEHYLIRGWSKCNDLLNDYDCVGTQWTETSGFYHKNDVRQRINRNDSHYAGNFWWATAKYISSLDTKYLFEPESLDGESLSRWRSEFWIGTNNPKHYSFNHIRNITNIPHVIPGVDFKMEQKKLIEEPFELKLKPADNTGKPKICMISMFKNEANNIERMLRSVAPHISFYVLQDNGSTDGTGDIAIRVLEEYGVKGILYKVEEGWVNFGWNRDHLLQTALKSDHDCDWIMKMDCDETLEVDSDFDWTPLHDFNNISFHVTSIAPGIVYFRAWIWNARKPWKFNHDPAHETIYLDDGITGENFPRYNLSNKFRMVSDGQHMGESYSVATKYMTDALNLEEKLIREGTMLSDLYHFWYVGKSYEDCYRGDFFPLKLDQQKHFAERCIFYWNQFINHNYRNRPFDIDEMSYYAKCGIGNAHRFLGDNMKAIECYLDAEKFCPVRNDHLVYLAEVYASMNMVDEMYEATSKLVKPERKNPFPDYCFIINTNMYHDTGTYVQTLHGVATQAKEAGNKNVLRVNPNKNKRVYVVDDFYKDPDAVRDFALKQNFNPDIRWYKGNRSDNRFINDEIKKSFEEIMGRKITVWEEHGQNGKFQWCTPEDLLVYHYDDQTWAGLVYLTPDAPLESGTSLYAHKETKIRHADTPGADYCFSGGYYDRSKFELVDTIGNVYNRLVLFNSRCFHSAAEYFGTNKYNSRLFHLFFFD